MPLVEIRLPTYRRPQLLERTLRSLQVQTCRDWVALAMDDSPEQEGRDVVARMGDARIQYRPNVVRLGCAGNLDQAFATRSYTGAAYACLVEDDNWFLPEFLTANIRALEHSGLSIMLRNQKIFLEVNGAEPVSTGNTTRGCVFTEGVVTVLRLRASLFFCEGISNGGLFWRTSAKSNLQVGPEVTTSPMQEYCRSLRVCEPVYFADEPLAAFSLAPQTSRELLANRAFNRGRQSIWRRLLAFHGAELVQEAHRLARTSEMKAEVTAALFDTLALSRVSRGDWGVPGLRQIGKGIAKIATIPDPLAEFWRVNGEKVLNQ